MDKDRERPKDGQRQKRDALANMDNAPIPIIDTIIRGPHVGEESQNAQKNYVRKTKERGSNNGLIFELKRAIIGFITHPI